MRAATRERMISIMARGLVISVLTEEVTYTFTVVRSKKRKLQRSELWTVDTAAPGLQFQETGGVQTSTPPET